MGFRSPASPLAPAQTPVVGRVQWRYVETFRASVAPKIEGQSAGTPAVLALFHFLRVLGVYGMGTAAMFEGELTTPEASTLSTI